MLGLLYRQTHTPTNQTKPRIEIAIQVKVIPCNQNLRPKISYNIAYIKTIIYANCFLKVIIIRRGFGNSNFAGYGQIRAVRNVGCVHYASIWSKSSSSYHTNA